MNDVVAQTAELPRQLSATTVGVVEGDRSVVVMMVGLLLPVKHRVRNLLCIRERRRLPGDGEGLPKRGEQQKNEGEPTRHGASLADRTW